MRVEISGSMHQKGLTTLAQALAGHFLMEAGVAEVAVECISRRKAQSFEGGGILTSNFVFSAIIL